MAITFILFQDNYLSYDFINSPLSSVANIDVDYFDILSTASTHVIAIQNCRRQYRSY